MAATMPDGDDGCGAGGAVGGPGWNIKKKKLLISIPFFFSNLNIYLKIIKQNLNKEYMDTILLVSFPIS